jgi:outer membrane protein assembly factor BamB
MAGTVGGRPSVSGGLIYVTTSTSAYGIQQPGISAIDTASLGLRWTAVMPEGASDPVVADGRVIEVSNASVMALDAFTGSPLWQTGPLAQCCIDQQPAVAHGVAYLTSFWDGTVYAIDIATGAQLWTVKVQVNGQVIGQVLQPATVANGVVYIETYVPHSIMALSSDTGATLASYELPMPYGAFAGSAPIVTGGRLFATACISYCTTDPGDATTLYEFTLDDDALQLKDQKPCTYRKVPFVEDVCT